MITQIRPSIHHLGDQIIWVSSEISKGRNHFDTELTNGIYELIPNITWEPVYTRYNSMFELDFPCDLVKFDESKFVTCEIPDVPYVTIQFDSSRDNEPDSNEKRTHSLDENWKIWIMNKYRSMGFELVDIGGKRWSLEETAYIIKHSQGHVGAVSGFSIFSRCVGDNFIHQYYNTGPRELMEAIPEMHLGYISLFAKNNIISFFRDPNLNI
jgi:hypothetical protein